MKRTTTIPVKRATATTHQPSDPLTLLRRIELEFLDEYVCEKRGYDPYDTSKGRAPDIWATKRKRA
jgi:hypothetical protein